MADEKTCPKCPNSPAMKRMNVLGIIPAMLDDRFTSQTVGKNGYQVQVHECPNCHLVELYHGD